MLSNLLNFLKVIKESQFNQIGLLKKLHSIWKLYIKSNLEMEKLVIKYPIKSQKKHE